MGLIYIIKEAFSGFTRARFATIASITTITISLLLLGIFFVISTNTSKIMKLILDRVKMEAFIQEPISQQQINILREQILKIEGVDSLVFISKEKASEIFKKDFGEDIKSILDFNPLPPSYIVFLKNEYKNSINANSIYLAIKSLKDVQEVVYRKDLIEFIDKRTKTLNWIGLVVGTIFSISAIFLVYNTIRLAIYSKRNNIQTMKLVGATRWTIRLPFILEGIIQGIIGGLVSSLLLYFILQLLSEMLAEEIKEFIILDPYISLFIIILGTLLGFLGSLISVRKFISESVIK